MQQKLRLFDHLVGAAKYRNWDGDAERFSGFEIDIKLHFGGLHHRQVAGLLTLENPPGIDAGLAIALAEVGTIAHQTARQL